MMMRFLKNPLVGGQAGRDPSDKILEKIKFTLSKNGLYGIIKL